MLERLMGREATVVFVVGQGEVPPTFRHHANGSLSRNAAMADVARVMFPNVVTGDWFAVVPKSAVRFTSPSSMVWKVLGSVTLTVDLLRRNYAFVAG